MSLGPLPAFGNAKNSQSAQGFPDSVEPPHPLPFGKAAPDESVPKSAIRAAPSMWRDGMPNASAIDAMSDGFLYALALYLCLNPLA